MMMSDRAYLKHLWRAGVAAVEGRRSVLTALTQNNIPTPDVIISVGKAAGAMALGACERFGSGIPGLVVTKYGHVPEGLPDACTVIEAAHPTPDAQSLKAGLAVLDLVNSIPAEAHVLCLISGGASSLVELPEDGMVLDALRVLNGQSISAGLPIGAINTARIARSKIKGGKIFAGLPPCSVTVLSLSDVEGDSLTVIGSGLFDCHSSHVPGHVAVRSIMAGSNAIAREAVASAAGDVCLNAETLYRDVFQVADMIADTVVNGVQGLYIFGGEPTVILPDRPGRGGRNQSLAVALSIRFEGRDVAGLVAGTDGTDGPTDAAGGFISKVDNASAQAALDHADCYPFLAASGDLFSPGPTGTNVMDLALILKR